jgi:hypothetical protein
MFLPALKRGLLKYLRLVFDWPLYTIAFGLRPSTKIDFAQNSLSQEKILPIGFLFLLFCFLQILWFSTFAGVLCSYNAKALKNNGVQGCCFVFQALYLIRISFVRLLDLI